MGGESVEINKVAVLDQEMSAVHRHSSVWLRNVVSQWTEVYGLTDDENVSHCAGPMHHGLTVFVPLAVVHGKAIITCHSTARNARTKRMGKQRQYRNRLYARATAIHGKNTNMQVDSWKETGIFLRPLQWPIPAPLAYTVMIRVLSANHKDGLHIHSFPVPES